MFVLLICMGRSPYNRSIWQGLARGFQRHGCRVQVVDAAKVPVPASWAELPDLIFAVHGGYVPEEAVKVYRAAGVKTAVYLLDEPYEVDRSVEWARHYDWVFTVDRNTVPIHSEYSQSMHLPCGYDDEVFGTEGASVQSKVLVLGTCFAARETMLASVLDKWGAHITWVGPGWRQICKVGIHYDRLVLPEECAAFYRGADISLNIHRSSIWSHFGELNRRRIKATHLNPRFWEAAACGGFPLSSYRADLPRYVHSAASFSSSQELARKLDYFMENPAARRKQSRLFQKAMRQHSYYYRAETVLNAVAP